MRGASRGCWWALLRFTGPMARYVAIEQWHHEQRVQRASDGSLLLDVPYTGSAELVRDVLAFGSDVEVLSPPALRQQIAQTLVQAQRPYEQPAADWNAA